MKTKKPRFYMMDINNYHEDFLKEIILWQNERIKELEEKKQTYNLKFEPLNPK